MAAEMAVEIMAQEEIQTEDRQAIVQEDHASEKEAHQETALKEGLMVVTVRRDAPTETVRKEGLTEESVRRDVHMASVRREELMESALSVAKDAHTATAPREDHMASVRRDVLMENAQRDAHMVTGQKEEAMELEDLVQERTSTTSATRMRAASER
mgnify:FL=1